MTGLLDGLLAVLVAGLLNLFVLYQIRARSEATETTFLVQVYSWTILLRYSLAIALNIFAANGPSPPPSGVIPDRTISVAFSSP
jgi:hypothetical protein